MCGGNKGTTTSTTSPNPTAGAAYTNLLNEAQATASTPYQAYTGELVAPVNAQQQTGISNINANANYAQPYIQQAAGLATQGATPITQQQIQQYESPYTQDVVNSTEAQFQNQNQQQLEGVKGNAIAQGALGGNREAVAEAETTNQQNLAQAPVIAGLENQGYTTGLNTSLTEQQAAAQGAYSLGNLGVSGQNAALTGANAQVGAGTLEQQTQQSADTAAYQQYLNQLAYPFQTEQWLAGIDTGVGSQLGGTSTTTAPAPSIAGQVAGAVTSGVSALGATGAFGSAGWLAPALAGLADGGGVANHEMSVPESRATLVAQQKQLIKGHRRAQMFPHGTRELSLPRDMSRIPADGGVFHYDPKKISPDEIKFLSSHGRENELLDLGPFTKHEIMHRISGGEIPVAIVERDHSGTEVRAAAGTHSTAPYQIAAMHRTKSPGHTLHLEDPRHTIAHRIHHRAMGGIVSHYDTGGGVATNYSALGGTPTPALPYSGGNSWIPQNSIKHGDGAPKPPGAQQQNNGPSMADQAKAISQIASAFKNGPNAPLNINPNPTAATPVGATGVVGASPEAYSPTDYSGSTGAIYASGGGVRGYADGGDPTDVFTTGAPSSGVLLQTDADNAATPPATFVPQGVATDVAPSSPVDATPTQDNGIVGDVPLPRPRPTPPSDLPPMTGVAAVPASLSSDKSAPTSGYADNMARIAAAHRQIESSDKDHPDGDYSSVGHPVPTGPNKGSRPYGAYQVMDFNIGPWTKEVLGTAMTPQEFLNNPEAQDAVYKAKMGQYIDKGGLDYAVHQWLGPGSKDFLGTTQDQYLSRFKAALGGQPTGVADTRAASLPQHATVTQASGVAPPVDTTTSGAPSGVDFSQNSKLWPSLMAAGFGMMASRSPYLGVAIGQGGESGMQTYAAEQQQEREAAMNQSKIALETHKLDQEAKFHQDSLDNESRPYSQMTASEQEKANLARLQYQREINQPVKSFDARGAEHFYARGPDGFMHQIDVDAGSRPIGPLSPGAPGVPPAAQPAPANPNAPSSSAPQQQGAQPAAYKTVADADIPEGLRPPEYTRDDKYLATLDPEEARLVKGLVDYQLSPASFSLRSTHGAPSERERLVREAATYDSSYDQTLYPAKQKAVNDFLAGTSPGSSATVMIAGNTAMLHAGEMYDLVHQIKALPPDQQTWFTKTADTIEKAANAAGIPFASYTAQWVKNNGIVGTPAGEALNKWAAGKNLYSDEMSKFYAGGQGSEAERERNIAAINPALSEAELKGALYQQLIMLRDKVSQYNNRLMAGMGPAAWRSALRADPDLVTTYKNSRDTLNHISQEELKRVHPAGGAAPTSGAAAPSTSSIPSGAVTGKVGGVPVYKLNNQLFTLDGKPFQRAP